MSTKALQPMAPPVMHHEIIDLLSSDDDVALPPPPPRPALKVSKLSGGNRDTASKSWFPSSDEIDFLLDEPRTKRRRLTPLDDNDASNEIMDRKEKENISGASRSRSRSPKSTTGSPIPALTAFLQTLEGSDPILFTSSQNAPAAAVVTKKRPPLSHSTMPSRTVGDFDPIVFTSSPAAPGPPKTRTKPTTMPPWLSEPIGSSSDELPSPKAKTSTNLSAKTAALLAEITGNKKPNRRKDAGGRASGNLDKRKKTGITIDLEDEIPSSQPKQPKRTRMTSAERELKAKEKETNKAEKSRAREADKETRRVEKEAEAERKKLSRDNKAREKASATAIADVNKARWDKNISTPEMIVDLPSSFTNQPIDAKVREKLKDLEVEVTSYTSMLPDVVKWRRKTTSAFDENLGHWVPRELQIKEENHVLAFITAKQFIAMSSSTDEVESLSAHVDLIKRKFGKDIKIIYMIEGLDDLLRKAKNARNRAWQANVRSQIPSSDVPAPQRKSKSSQLQQELLAIDEEAIETSLLTLQMKFKCFIHHTADSSDSAHWISNFTQHISAVPYKAIRDKQNLENASFCMESGQVRCGEDPTDTFGKMLQQVVRVTPGIANAVVAEFGSVRALYDAFTQGGQRVCEDVRKLSNKDGTRSDSRVGPAVSRRLHKVFTARDPSLMDI